MVGSKNLFYLSQKTTEYKTPIHFFYYKMNGQPFFFVLLSYFFPFCKKKYGSCIICSFLSGDITHQYGT